MYPASRQIDPFAIKQRDLKILSVVKFPYVHYVTIICVLSLIGCCIKAYTAVLVGALLILVNRVKCIPIYLVSFPNQYSQRWSPGQQVQLITNSVVTSDACFQPTAESPDVFTCNPVVALLRVFGAQTVLVFIDIRGNQGRVL